MIGVRIGDVIATKLNYPNLQGQRVLQTKILTQEAADYASRLVALGRWYIVGEIGGSGDGEPETN